MASGKVKLLIEPIAYVLAWSKVFRVERLVACGMGSVLKVDGGLRGGLWIVCGNMALCLGV